MSTADTDTVDSADPNAVDSATATMYGAAPVVPLPLPRPAETQITASTPPYELDTKPIASSFDYATSQAGVKIAESIAFLERIEQIEILKVLKRDGHLAYVMEMYVRKASSNASEPVKRVDALVLHANPLVGKQLEANYQVDRHFAEFAELRRMLQYIAHLQGGKRHAAKCAYCSQLLGFVEHSVWQPRFWMRLFTTQTKRRDVLGTFVRKIVELAVASKSCERWPCEAYYHIPLLVEKFLRKPADGSLGII